MKTKTLTVGLLLGALGSLLLLAGCSRVHANDASEAPPPAQVVIAPDATLFSVDHPEQFPLCPATARASAPELVATGVVSPDVSRNVPVISLASGRVIGIYARLGDTVEKGQLLLRIRSDDISGGYSNYRKAIADELLARAQLKRIT